MTTQDIVSQLLSIFKLLDLHGNGDLDATEFKVGLETIGVSLSDEQASKIFQSIDTEHNGYIDCDSFSEWLNQAANAAIVKELGNQIQKALENDNGDDDANQEFLIEMQMQMQMQNMMAVADADAATGTDTLNSTKQAVANSDSTNSHFDVVDLESDEKLFTDNLNFHFECSEAAVVHLDLDPKVEMMPEFEAMRQALSQGENTERRRINRQVSGLGVFRSEDEKRWESADIDDEMSAMKKHLRRLSQTSLDFNQVQDEANAIIEQFEKQSRENSTNTTETNRSPDETDETAVKTLIVMDQTDISQIAQPLMQQSLTLTQEPYTTNLHTALLPTQRSQPNAARREQDDTGRDRDRDRDRREKENCVTANSDSLVVRFIAWYVSPLHQRQTLHRLWYHGANLVFSSIVAFVMLGLFVLMVLFLPFCAAGLYFLYVMILCGRKFARIDAVFCHYFFGGLIFNNKFSIFVPTSHCKHVHQRLLEYVADPHILQIVVYFTFIKLPLAFVLSGCTLVLFSGVVSILLSPLVYWISPSYFNSGQFCLFGSQSYHATQDSYYYSCSGWMVASFSETLVAFFFFFPVLPLILHCSKFTAKLCALVTANFLKINIH